MQANTGRILMEGQLGILTAMFEAASINPDPRTHMENR
jgi:hypothetical protein